MTLGRIDIKTLLAEEPFVTGSVQRLHRCEVAGEKYLVSVATDAGSAFDVGTYFSIPGSGRSRTELRHAVYKNLASPEIWRSLTRQDVEVGGGGGQGARRWNSSILEACREHGVTTHHVGLVDDDTGDITDENIPTAISLVQEYPVVRPNHFAFQGRPAWDYHEIHRHDRKLIALEHIFRLGSPAGSAIALRYAEAERNDPDEAAHMLAGLGLHAPVVPWGVFETILYDASTKYEDHDRYLSWQETVHIAAIDHRLFEEVITTLELCTVAVNALFARVGFSLWDIKWEAAVDEGKVVIVDTVDHDSIRITSDEPHTGRRIHCHFNKQAVRDYFRLVHPDWVAALDSAKQLAKSDPAARSFREIYDEGVDDGTYLPIPSLDPAFADIQSDKYDLVAGGVSGRIDAQDVPGRIAEIVRREIAFYKDAGALDLFYAQVTGD